MSNSSSPTCPRCGAPTPMGTTDQLCPACLMSGALAAPSQSLASSEPTEFPRDFGGYRLLGLLGTGGMGTVYEAEQLSTGRRVALKMLEQQLDSTEMRQRFLREGRLAASVNHPNSLYIFGSEEIECTPVITMEIAGSGTLNDILKKRGPFPVPEAVDAILDVISGLEAALAAGVLHRDVKPSNCFVSPDGSVKVGDFGLSVSTMARDDSYATATGVIMGTPAYASPEQLRGDDLDVRADIYSVGATLFTLLTGQAPFEGRNAVQVVTNVIDQKPKPVRELREEVPPGLERVVGRCLAKEREVRYDDHMALRNALLPFSSKEPEPASLKVRVAAGWIDYLLAFLVPYVALMLFIGGDEFHVGPLVERTLYSARYYLACFGCGFLYFSLAEGIWGAGLGKRLKGLRVVGTNGRPPGIGRALIRILVPILCCEGVRIPLLLVSISATHIDDLTTANLVLFFVTVYTCPWIPVLLVLRARRENGFATAWDLASGTRVVMKPQGSVRSAVEPTTPPGVPVEHADSLGPYEIIAGVVRDEWIVATDPVLRRQVWLLRRVSPGPSLARRDLARSGRLRWLQKVETAAAVWDAFEAPSGVAYSSLIEDGRHVPWGTLRHWLHDLATELWAATSDQTLPAELGLDHVWITAQGRAVLLDDAWPGVETAAERLPVGDVTGQQRFLHAVAAGVESTGLPLHARPMLRNLEKGKFEKLSFFTGILRGLLNKPARVGRGIRAGSIFMLPLYAWILFFIGAVQGEGRMVDALGDTTAWLALTTIMLVLSVCALAQFVALPLRTTAGHSTFRLAVVNGRGEPARMSELFVRWAIVWLPLVPALVLVAQSSRGAEGIAFFSALVLLLLWISAAVHAVLHPERGLHDRMARTWVVRR